VWLTIDSRSVKERESCESDRDGPVHESIAQSSTASNKIKIQIGLPRSLENPKLRVFDLTIPSKMTTGELKGFLADRFNKNKDKWDIVVTGGNESPKVLDNNRTLVEFSSDKTKRLYFYPGIFEK
jgi:hypothetical protein